LLRAGGDPHGLPTARVTELPNYTNALFICHLYRRRILAKCSISLQSFTLFFICTQTPPKFLRLVKGYTRFLPCSTCQSDLEYIIVILLSHLCYILHAFGEPGVIGGRIIGRKMHTFVMQLCSFPNTSLPTLGRWLL